jgi:prophage regulatory protein
MSRELYESYKTRQELEKLFKVSRATIYRWVNNGHFPKPIHLGANMVRWKASDIDAWVIAREASNLRGDSDA